MRRDTIDRKLAGRAGDPDVPSSAHFDDPHKFPLIVTRSNPGDEFAMGDESVTLTSQTFPSKNDSDTTSP